MGVIKRDGQSLFQKGLANLITAGFACSHVSAAHVAQFAEEQQCLTWSPTVWCLSCYAMRFVTSVAIDAYTDQLCSVAADTDCCIALQVYNNWLAIKHAAFVNTGWV